MADLQQSVLDEQKRRKDANILMILKAHQMGKQPNMEITQDPTMGEGLKFQSPETGDNAAFYNDGTTMSSETNQSPSMIDKINLAGKLKSAGVPFTDEQLQLMLNNSKNGY